LHIRFTQFFAAVFAQDIIIRQLRKRLHVVEMHPKTSDLFVTFYLQKQVIYLQLTSGLFANLQQMRQKSLIRKKY